MKIISLFSVVRGYNIPVIILAQYLAAIFILSTDLRALDVLLDFNLFVIVFASAITIASGYIINSFYDSKKDLINKPNKTMLDRLVSQKTKLQVYFGLNFLVFLMAMLVSWRAALFFSSYIFLIWFYSHKIKKYPIVGNIMAALLAVLPFFGILLYYFKIDGLLENVRNEKYYVIFAHASFLFLLILIREMIKDLENIKGDMAQNYRTLPVILGESFSKKVITFLIICSIFPVYILIEIYDVGYMDIYFYVSFIILIFFIMKLWNSNSKENYLLLHNIIKFIIVAGVFSIILIKPSVLIHGREVLAI
ncbi:MAG TPA: geranylgeranylglycerol-phosphate geranylgeranyltransferase [Flavobacterium sp.]|nr:geranylgeranylglycerol-phosphate geranylgeranyltransferase [Flavobacterium sp.]HQX02569.1 geranylgeranylglycerol-phosphate geranylgeranyltransferase [Flavobacterium sp.]HRZ31076.1 geranylgeranylglycerol-phosphate geranylgeranyltransferase [Flavobacterium sp.]HRZ73438.1 geranylgeranylglycerol-phosphate geranylgeranyltransferase [Flavobacterium sp.]